jgi:hypothetical protein
VALTAVLLPAVLAVNEVRAAPAHPTLAAVCPSLVVHKRPPCGARGTPARGRELRTRCMARGCASVGV